MSSTAAGSGPGPRDFVPPAPASAGPPAGGGGPLRRTVRVVNPLGLHMRAADRFARTAKQYSCAVAVWNGQSRADGKDVWGLIALCVLPGVEVTLEVDGPGAADALDPLADLLAAPGGEDYTI